MRGSAPRVSITYENGALVYSTPYDPVLVAALKHRIPATDRQWDKTRGVWLVAPGYANTLVQISDDCLDVRPTLPAIPPTSQRTETRVLDVRYIGTTKSRDDGERTAFGWCDGGWSVIFSESVLQMWFGMDQPQPDAAPTLYGVLGLRPSADDNDIRKAYRRLARQWHPDVCREPNAKEQFIVIQRAYEALSNPMQRARYDAGLMLEATLGKAKQQRLDGVFNSEYRSPLRCGLILCSGITILGRFIVNEIKLWNDITDAQGRVLSTSWPLGADTFLESWV